MIQLTRLNKEKFTLNALYIEKIQSVPDTTITLTNGKNFFVLESEEEVAQKITQFYKQIGLVYLPGTVRGDSNEQ